MIRMTDKENTSEIFQEFPKSYWKDSVQLPEFASLTDDINVDVVIIGGGITGITSAYLLKNEGLNVALLEADRLLNGTTGHTTAKITAQHDLIYDELIKNMGKSSARLYYEANIAALDFIKNTVDEHQIDCDFSEQDAYVYATTEEYELKVSKEAKAYEDLGINGRLVDTIPLDIKIKNAVMMDKQAQFHPLKYLSHLIESFTDQGGHIFEHTTAVNIETGDKPIVHIREGQRITANYVLSCSHFPFYEGTGLYSTRMYADRSYAIAAQINKNYPGGIYISADKPVRSLRSATINGEDMLLIVGESHKTGQGKDTLEHYKALASFGEKNFGLTSIPYHWSAQDLTTLDNVPYIGEITSGKSNILIATGYRKWGMSNGTAAALLFRDIVLSKDNNFKKLFSPSRFYVNPSLKNFLVENADVVSHLIKGKLQFSNIKPDTLENDEGAIISIKGERKGAYRDTDGKLHIVDTTCTHIGCEVEWNNSERTWDCPCHGSRFSYTGEVIEGPAEKPLQQYDYKMMDNLTSDDSGY